MGGDFDSGDTPGHGRRVAYGETAGEVAVIVKLVRVLLLAPMVIILGAWYAREKRRKEQAYVAEGSLEHPFPPFIIGFLILAVANSSIYCRTLRCTLRTVCFGLLKCPCLCEKR